MQIKILGLSAVLLFLAACGDTFAEQALIGGGAGAATAVVLSGNVVAGALIGGAANTVYCKSNPGKC